MRRGFWNGIITGGLIGAAIGMMLAPGFRGDNGMRLWERSRSLGRSAARFWRSGKDMAEDMTGELLKD